MLDPAGGGGGGGEKISAKSLADEIEFTPVRLIEEIADGTTVTSVASPPVLPAVVMPLVVEAGWLGSVTV